MTTYGATPQRRARADPSRSGGPSSSSLERGRYRIASSQGGVPTAASAPAAQPGRPRRSAASGSRTSRREVGLDFRHGAFRFGMSDDTTAMMGGGALLARLRPRRLARPLRGQLVRPGGRDRVGGERRTAAQRALPERAGTVRGRERQHAGADLPLRGNGCVAADFDLDGHTDLYVTTAGIQRRRRTGTTRCSGTTATGRSRRAPAQPGINAVRLARRSGGRRRERRRAAGPVRVELHGRELADPVLRCRLPDEPPRDARPSLPQPGRTARTAARRSARSGSSPASKTSGSGTASARCSRTSIATGASTCTWPTTATRTSCTGTSRSSGGLGFRLDEVAKREAVDDPNAGMGIAAADFSLDGRPDLLVTNSREQLHAAYRSRPPGARRAAFADARPELAAVLGTRSTGWGASWADLDLDSDLDLVVANGAIPVLDLAKNAQRIQALENLGGWKRAALRTGLERSTAAHRASTAAVSRRPTTTTTVTSTSRSTPSAESSCCFETRAAPERGHWLSVQLRAFAPGAVVTAVLPRRSQARSRGARRQQLPVVRGSARALRPRRTRPRVKELRVRFPDGSVDAPARSRRRSDRRRRAVS